MVLLLLDSDSDCPKEVAPDLVEIMQKASGLEYVSAVLAKIDYESWFVGAADSLGAFIRVEDRDHAIIADPEACGSGKRWVETRFTGIKYSEAVDQPRMTAVMDLEACRRRCPSFDKLCRELQRSLPVTVRH